MGDGEDVVERVGGLLLVPFALFPLEPSLHLDDAVFAEAGQDVADVLVEPLNAGVVELAGHLGRGLEGEAGELLAELAQVVDDGDVLGREVGYLPVVEQAEAQAEFVDKLRLAVAGASADHHVAACLEGHQVVEALHLDGGSALHPMFVEGEQLLADVGGGLDADERDVVGGLDAVAHLLHAVQHEDVVGILAPLGPLHQLAPVGIEPADELVAQHQALLVVVEGEHDAHLVFEVGLDEAVEVAEVFLGAVGHGDGFEVAALDEGEGVELSLGDVADGAGDDGVDVPGDELRLGQEGEPLVEGAALEVDVFVAVEVVEADAAYFFVLFLRLLVVGVGEGDAVALQQVEVEAAGLSEVLDEGLR